MPILASMTYDVSKRAGEFAIGRARREWVRSGLMMLTMLVGIAAALLALQIDHSAAYVLPLVALAFLAGLLGRRRSGTALPWSLGAESERAVGEVLDELRAEGFIVVHDIEQPREGNVDHLVSGPTGVFMIETKRSRYTARDLTKARRQAARLHDVLGAWVTPVICLDRRHQRPVRHDRVWIVGCPFLRGWIRAQAGQLADVERMARFPDQL